MDLSTKGNLQELKKIGNKLLDKLVSTMNIEIGLHEKVTKDTIETKRDALTRFA